MKKWLATFLFPSIIEEATSFRTTWKFRICDIVHLLRTLGSLGLDLHKTQAQNPKHLGHAHCSFSSSINSRRFPGFWAWYFLGSIASSMFSSYPFTSRRHCLPALINKIGQYTSPGLVN